MRLRTWLATALALLATVGAASAALASSALPAQPDDDLLALDGEWIFVEDRTKDHTLQLRMTADGLLVSVVVDRPAGTEAVGLYRPAEDIPGASSSSAGASRDAWLACPM